MTTTTTTSNFNLDKAGARFSLDKADLAAVNVNLSWDTNENKTTGSDTPFDLDSSACVLDFSGKMPNDNYAIFYNNLTSPDDAQAVTHKGDNLTGAGEGVDEQIVVKLDQITPEIATIVFAVSIHKADERGQNFQDVANATFQVNNAETGEELCGFNLSEGFIDPTTGVVLASISRDNVGAPWIVERIGTAVEGGLGAILESYSA